MADCRKVLTNFFFEEVQAGKMHESVEFVEPTPGPYDPGEVVVPFIRVAGGYASLSLLATTPLLNNLFLVIISAPSSLT